MIPLGRDCAHALSSIKYTSWFPYKTGKLRDEATYLEKVDRFTYRITYDEKIAQDKKGRGYISFLEEGTREHDIPRAFGRPLPFGIGGRFNGKFHPGSFKHQGFISDKSVKGVINYFASRYNGELK